MPVHTVAMPDSIEKQVIPCGVSQVAPLFPILNGSVIMPFQVDPNGSLFVNQQGTIPADGITPSAQPIDATSYSMVWNGASWDRVKSIPDNANGQAALVSGLPGVVARLQGYDPLLGNWNRVQVSNDNTDAQIPSATGHVAAIAHRMAFNGASWDRVRTPNVFITAQITAQGINNIWTPAAGKKFRLMGFELQLVGDTTALAAVEIGAIFQEGASISIGYESQFYVPSVTANSLGNMIVGKADWGNGYLATAANNSFVIYLTTALNNGRLRVNYWGTEE